MFSLGGHNRFCPTKFSPKVVEYSSSLPARNYHKITRRGKLWGGTCPPRPPPARTPMISCFFRPYVQYITNALMKKVTSQWTMRVQPDSLAAAAIMMSSHLPFNCAKNTSASYQSEKSLPYNFTMVWILWLMMQIGLQKVTQYNTRLMTLTIWSIKSASKTWSPYVML